MNIAMLSGWHVHAKGYANEINSCEGFNVTAVWDELPERGKEWAAELGCTFYQNLDELLSDDTIDAVVVNAPTNMHPEVIIKAAEAGKAIFTEKVLALTLSEAESIKEAVERNNVLFTISYPHRLRPTLIKAKRIAESGDIGKITYARVRNVHNGSVADWLPPHFYDKTQCGGGAMIDLGAHPMYTLEWICGKPKSVVSMFTNVTDRPVEDNAVSVLEFEGGIIGVSETGFVSTGNPYTLEISGTEGAIMLHGADFSFCGKSTEGKWTKIDVSDKEALYPIKLWAECLTTGKDSPFPIDEAVSLSALMEAAYESFRTGKKVKVK
ncbi:MAG: Gfo/Idh/MocA family oxidoreductase [Clostridiales bacterium]|nr:Gfo/Idh/MocA family oxidoreductase [Clostridiales bacterium]